MISLEREDWIKTFTDSGMITVGGSGYELYVNALSQLDDDMAKHAQWKLKGEALTKTTVTTLATVSALKEEKFRQGFAANYAKKDKWLYENDKYIIVAPKRMEDIVSEGLVLKHCAKEFIPAISNGETMLFFIRKKGEEDIPFFTLEIRDDKIRQCHGMCNQNVDSYGNGLDKFLKNFCKAKNIPITLGDKLLQA